MKKKSVILKYLLSYFAVLLIPFAFSYFFITHHVFETMKEELKASNIYNVQQIQFGVDNCIQQMESIVTQFSLNENINVKSDLQDVASTVLIKTEFEHYLQISDYLMEIGLYILDDSYLVTSKTSLKPYLFNNLMLIFEDDMKNIFSQALNEPQDTLLSTSKVVYYNQTEEIIIFIRHIPGLDSDEPANMVFFWDTEYIKELTNVEGTQLEYIIIDDNNQEVFSTTAQEYDMEGILEGIDEGAVSFEYEGKLIAVQQSDYSTIKYILITELDSVYEVVNKLSVELLMVMVAIFIVGSTIIYIAMNFTYKPIADVKQRMLEYVPKEKNNKNEIQFIEDSLDYLVKKNKVLFDDTKRSSKVFLLRKLLQGVILSVEEFNLLGEAYMLQWNKEYFVVLSIVFHKNDENIIVDIEKLESILNSYFKGYVFTDIKNKYTFIANLSEQELTIFNEEILEIHAFLHEEYVESQICIASGTIYKDIQDISKSYAEAVVAGDYRFVKGLDSIIFQKDLLTKKNITYPYYLLEKFQASFQNRNEATTQEALDEIADYIRETSCPIHYARSICYDLISILSISMHNMGEVGLTKKVDGYYNKILADFTTVEEMIEVSRNICTNMQAYVQADNKQKSIQMIENIKHEIKQKCFDVNFSVESLAESFDMTFPGMSALYRNKTGQTIIDYVTELRMEKAKDYLTQTDMPVAKITEEIGYISPSSFIRKFKGIYGVTPKQYASNYKSKESCDIEE